MTSKIKTYFRFGNRSNAIKFTGLIKHKSLIIKYLELVFNRFKINLLDSIFYFDGHKKYHIKFLKSKIQ
jgi:hypothetical protein